MLSKFVREKDIKLSTRIILQQLPIITGQEPYKQIAELKAKYEFLKSRMNDLDRFLIYPIMKGGENVRKLKISELLEGSLAIKASIQEIQESNGLDALTTNFHLLWIQATSLACRGFDNIYKYEEMRKIESDHLHKVVESADEALKYFDNVMKKNPKIRLEEPLLEELNFCFQILSKYGKQIDDEERALEAELLENEKNQLKKEESEIVEKKESKKDQKLSYVEKNTYYKSRIFEYVQKFEVISVCYLLYPHLLDELKKDFAAGVVNRNIFLGVCEHVAKYSTNVLDQLIANKYILKINLFTRNGSLQWGTYNILDDAEWLLDGCDPDRFNQYLDYIRDEFKTYMLPVVDKLRRIEIAPLTQSACSLKEWGDALADFSRYLTMNYNMMKQWIDDHKELTDKELDKLNFMLELNLGLTLDVENLITQYEDHSHLMQELMQKENLACKDEDDFQNVFDLIIKRKEENKEKAKIAKKNYKKCKAEPSAPFKPANRSHKQSVKTSINISSSQEVKKSDSEEELSLEEKLLLKETQPQNLYYAELASLVIISKRLSDQAQKELRIIREKLFRQGKLPLRRKERTQIENDFEKVLQKSKRLREQFKEYQKLASENIDPFQSDSYEFEKSTIHNKIQAIKDEYKILHEKLKQEDLLKIQDSRKRIQEIGPQEFQKVKEEHNKKYPDSPSNYSMDKKLRRKIIDDIEQELNELDKTLPEVLTSSQTFKCRVD